MLADDPAWGVGLLIRAVTTRGFTDQQASAALRSRPGHCAGAYSTVWRRETVKNVAGRPKVDL